MKVYRDIEQGTPAWLALRLGKATASEFASILAKGEYKMRTKCLKRVVAEMLTGKSQESFRNSHTDRGTEQEALARWAYEAKTGMSVERVAFVQHDTLDAGCSPDGLIVGATRGAEIKCVIPTVQLDTLRAKPYPSEHRPQVQGSMWITGFEEWDFCSYSPDMPEELRLHIVTVKRDDAYIATLETEVRRFLADRDAILEEFGYGDGRLLERQLQASLEKVAA